MSTAFILGDFLSNLAFGAFIGALSASAFHPGWGMLPAMLIGMIAGMALAFVWSTVVGIWLGAHESHMPTMLTGMCAGMCISMIAAMESLAVGRGAQLGAAVGLACLLFTYAMNALLRGKQKLRSVG
ncbi:MAG: hypothetical protein O3A53_11385 [Acidobacteria bacterium]|nr:hypothetical protein [Acidobacteriota bacterium]MDA1235393.1 hypothetical protein [Acidobacteriota bacterium]